MTKATTTTSLEDSLFEKTRNTNGWTPLVYPVSALCVNDDDSSTTSKNPCFPLEKNVLRAAVRELLILDQSVDAKTLEVASETTKFRDATTGNDAAVVGPLYLGHLDPSRWQVIARSNEKSARKKRKIKPDRKIPIEKKKKKTRIDDGRYVPSEQGQGAVERAENDSSFPRTEQQVENAEALTAVIVQRSYSVPDASFTDTVKTVEGPRNVVPRKVSDADAADNNIASLSLDNNDTTIKRLDGTYGNRDISRFYNLQNRTVISEKTPPFLEVSIASEFVLRNLAHQMTLKLVESFHDRTLRMFLGYKSSTLKRDRLLTVLSEYLFDVSHAMYAWKETERELLSEGEGASDDESLLQKRILDTLFDSRALRKIGGFDDSSLLPHALSICRLAEGGISWRAFAKTKGGQALLRHHRNGKPLLAGQKRRGQRVRTRIAVGSCDSSEAESRSRSSSITSYDAVEFKRDANVGDGIVDSVHEELWTAEREASLQMPDVLNVSLRKETSGSWGVLLSKEGDMCVVVRAPERQQYKAPGLKIGDVILSVGNELQASDGSERRDWFRFVVQKFKSSNELELVIRRVGSAHSIVSDDSSRGEPAAEN